MTERLRTASDHWRIIARQLDAAAAALIERDGIHILVDLSDHTAETGRPCSR
jgi:protein O-GlcNAc transferase